MTPRVLLRDTAQRFRNAGIPDPETDSALLLSFLTGNAPLSLRLDAETELPAEILNTFSEMVNRRLTREPLQYILHEAPFYGRLFYVDSRVLIPRPETEQLCTWALEFLPPAVSFHVLDLCCGSGCIGLTLASERHDLQITLADLSSEALEVAALNASRLKVSVALHQGDLTEGIPADSFDLIVSNPPYIPTLECSALQPEVLREPVVALDGGTDGMAFFRRIASEASRILKPKGHLLMELGAGESNDVLSLLSSAGFEEITVRKDFSGIPRMIHAVCPTGRFYV